MDSRTPIDWALLPIKKFAQFSGRAPRAEYWWFYLATVIISLILDRIDSGLGTAGMLSGVFSLAILVPWIAVMVRRLHDIDRTGLWLLLFVVPLVAVLVMAIAAAIGGYPPDVASFPFIMGMIGFGAAALVLFIFSILPGTVGPNRYGPDPYGPDDLEEVFA